MWDQIERVVSFRELARNHIDIATLFSSQSFADSELNLSGPFQLDMVCHEIRPDFEVNVCRLIESERVSRVYGVSVLSPHLILAVPQERVFVDRLLIAGR